MPTYEYVCKACEHRFEKRQSFSANPLRTCPECGEKALQKVIFASGVVFKGSGFYINDSKAKPSKSTSKSSSSDSKKAADPSSDSSSRNGKPSGSKKPSAATSSDE